MGTTFLKRQKEMKRLEKQREKAERRAQKKLASRTGNDVSLEDMNSINDETSSANSVVPSDAEPQS
jgi:hypothetical protein